MNRMNWREVFASLIVGILLLGNCWGQDPAQCQLCTGQSGQHVLCPAGQQCPRFYRVTDSQGEGSGTSGINCQTPATVVTTTTTADTVAVTTDGRENATKVAGVSTTPIIPAATTTTTTTTTPSSNQPSALSSSSSNITSTNQPPPPAPSSPSTTTTNTTLCKICLENCRLCNGSDAKDCLECAKDHDMADTDGVTRRCVRKKGEDSGLSVFIIAAAGGGGGALLLLVVVVVVACVCCRRRRRRRRGGGVERNEEEPGIGIGLTEMPATSEQPTSKTGESSKREEGHWRPTKPGDVPDYANVASTRPRPISIERGHDKVTRYVRDPTVKMATDRDQKPEAALPSTEEQELAELPAAPLPPPGGFSNKKKLPSDSRDPSRLNHPPTRSHTALPADTNPGERRRRAGPATASTLPSPSSSSAAPVGSDLHLPKFPIEEELERHTTVKRPAVVVPGEEEEEDEDPEEDYENLGAKAKLHTASDGERGPEGVHNPGLDVGEEEPEDDYVNQSALQAALDIDENPYQNIFHVAHR